METLGGGIEREAEEVLMGGRHTAGEEDIGREGSSEIREEMEGDKSVREEKMDEEAGGTVEEGGEDTTKGM
ncbi:hypothetical protein KI387_027405, partial [Taxus chinensis]